MPKMSFFSRIYVDVIGRAWQRRRLNERADGGGVVALDIALELRAKALNATIVARELATTAARVHGVTPDKLLLARILQILPPRHPGDGGVGDVVRSGRLT